MSGVLAPELGKIRYNHRLIMGMTAQNVADKADVPLAVVIGFELGWLGLEIEQAGRIISLFDMSLNDFQVLNRAINEWHGENPYD